MKFTLIICTYKRRKALQNLLDSVKDQSLYPNEILIIDGSPDDETQDFLQNNQYNNILYYKVDKKDRGLTKQRNFGLNHVNEDAEVVCFLDDDTVLSVNYFEQILDTFKHNPSIVGVGGVAVNENNWQPADAKKVYDKYLYYKFENWVYKEGSRNVMRNKLGLSSDVGPGRMPNFSHGKTCGFPITGKTYEVDLLIGMSMSFRRKVFENLKFSTYFEGYGLYEDADYSLRALNYGKNVINTNAHLQHFHDAAGRPNKFQYGKMVVRNGWYVWRVKNPNPTIKDKFKWYAITWLLIIIRLTNIITSNERKEAFTESVGRTVGCLSLLFNKPK